MSNFILTCGSTVDLPYSYIKERNIPVIFYTYTIDGIEYEDDMGRDPNALPAFYNMLADGKLPQTSQVNVNNYIEFFEKQLVNGDLLHVAFGSGMSNSVANAFIAADTLRQKYPERKIVVVDSTCSSSGYGMLVDEAADMRDRGCTIEETEKWILDNRKNVHHQFFCTDLSFFKRSGRVSGAAASLGSLLSICPIMRLNDDGKIIAYDKVRGKKNAIKTTIAAIDKHICDGRDYSGKLWVCHSNCIETALEFKEILKQNYTKVKGDIMICDIGTIIASHCGPGTVAAFFFGDEREPYPVK